MVLLDREEFGRWLSQARHTLDSARRDAEEGDYDWAAFKAQQAAEYALKGLLGPPRLRPRPFPAFGGFARGGGFPRSFLRRPRSCLHYIPARYPDAYPEGSPHLYYTARRASKALEAAETILAWVEGFYAL
jgi:HEPN domain-containing protein